MATALAPIDPAAVPDRTVAPVQAPEAGPVVPPAAMPSADASVKPVDLASMYEDAANSGNPASMYSLTSRVKGTPYESVVRQSAEVMQKGLKEFEGVAKPVLEAGGINTPAGRLAASKAYVTVADDPPKMRAFVELLMGNPDWRKFVTGGTPQTTVGYDKNGKQIERTVNQLGQIISMRDAETGQLLDRAQVAERGGFLPSLENALGFQQQKSISQFNVDAFNKSNAAVKDWSAKAPELKGLFSEMRQRLQNLYGADLTDDQRKQIGLFTNRNMGYSQTVSQGLNALAQKVDNKNVSLSRAEQNALSSVLGRFGWSVDASGSVVNKNGEAVTKNDLTQAQNTLTNGTEFERNFQQSKDDFLRSEVFKNLSGAEMKNLGRILDIQQMIEKTQLDLSAKHGSLPFLINPKSYQLGDEFSRGEALALIGEFNQDATNMYRGWRERQLETYRRSNTVPSAGELEAAFVQTPEYQRLRQDYANMNRQILSRSGGQAARTQEAPGQQWNIDIGLGAAAKETPAEAKKTGVPEPKAKREVSAGGVPKGYTKIGRTPDGKDVYRTPAGKTVVEQ